MRGDVVAAVAILTGVASGAEPSFTVVSRMPPTFSVVNRVPAEPPAPQPVLLGWWVPFSDGSVRFVPVPPKPLPAPGVPAVRPFRGPAFDPDHTCNNCGRSQYLVDRFLPTGRHVHRCSACGNEWQH